MAECAPSSAKRTRKVLSDTEEVGEDEEGLVETRNHILLYYIIWLIDLKENKFITASD